MKTLICDLDGTLCNAKHRIHHIEKNPKDWKSFFESARSDETNMWCLELMGSMRRSGYRILFVTGRGEEDRDLTERWLHDNVPWFIKYGESAHPGLLMRPAGDRRPDYEVKAEIYRELIEPKYHVLFVVEDRGSVVRMWRELGLTVLQCDDWEERAEPGIQAEIAAHFQQNGVPA